jgi:hypothetical protein
MGISTSKMAGVKHQTKADFGSESPEISDRVVPAILDNPGSNGELMIFLIIIQSGEH